MSKLLKSTLEGRIILSRHKLLKEIDWIRFKDIVIMNEIEADPIFYKYIHLFVVLMSVNMFLA